MRGFGIGQQFVVIRILSSDLRTVTATRCRRTRRFGLLSRRVARHQAIRGAGVNCSGPLWLQLISLDSFSSGFKLVNASVMALPNRDQSYESLQKFRCKRSSKLT